MNTQGTWLDINSKSVVGEIALSLAASHGHLNIVESQLKDSRPDVTATDNLGQTVLCKAAQNEHERFYRDTPAKGGGTCKTLSMQLSRAELRFFYEVT